MDGLDRSKQALREQLEVIVDRALSDFVVVLGEAADEAGFRPEKLERVLDSDSTVMTVALDWLELLDSDTDLPVEEAVRRAVDSAVIDLTSPVVVHIHKKGVTGVRVPLVFVAGLARSIEVACRASSSGRVDVKIENDGSIVIEGGVPLSDALVRAFAGAFGQVNRSGNILSLLVSY